jgi:regulator of PEP synthase PpsR (kinase-PPPase family)
LRAANVPISLDLHPPETLFDADPKRVVALTMNPRRLQTIRELRGEPWAGAMHYYADRMRVTHEISHVEALARQHGWRCIDVSYKAVEEVADEIVQSLKPVVTFQK